MKMLSRSDRIPMIESFTSVWSPTDREAVPAAR
jgi:hypothetical protein